MRFVDRSKVPAPKWLSSREVKAERERIDEFLRQPKSMRLQRRAPSSLSVSNPYVEGALYKLFHDKCAYCESSAVVLGTGHFRPRSSATLSAPASGRMRTRRPAEFAYPHHYSWLSFDWRNLYLTCQGCERAKRYLFPTTGGRAPLRTPIPEIYERESGTVVDPCIDFPSQHLTFDWSGKCYPLSARGQTTIEVLNLNRVALVKDRREAFHFYDLNARGTRLGTGGKPTEIARLFDERRDPYIGAFEILIRRALGIDHTKPYRERETASLLRELKVERIRSIFDEKALPPLPLAGSASRAPQAARSSTGRPQRFPLASRVAGTLALRRVEMRNFKGVADLALDLPEPKGTVGTCLMLLGENATGKTTILEAIALTALGREGIMNLHLEPLDYGAKARRKEWRTKHDRPLGVALHFFDRDEPVNLSLPVGAASFEVQAAPATVVLGYGPRRYFSPDRKARSSSPWYRVETLFEPQATIPHPDLWLKRLHDNQYAAVVRALREILLLDRSDSVIRRRGKVFVQSRRRLTPLDNLSEGYKSILALSIDIMRELLTHWDSLETAQGLVLIDEIETHLHPRWKMRIMTALRRAFPCVQFIVTTHDPLCLRGMKEGEVVVLHRTASGAIELVDDLPNIQGMRVDQLLTSDYFGLSSTADPELEATMSAYSNLVSRHPARGSGDHKRMVALGREIDKKLVAGETAVARIVQEATEERLAQSAAKMKASLRNYARTRAEGTNFERAAARREAVLSVVKMLKMQGDVGEIRTARSRKSSGRTDGKKQSRAKRV